MNFIVEFAKNLEICIGLTLFTIVFLQKSLIYIDFDRGSEPNQSPLHPTHPSHLSDGVEGCRMGSEKIVFF